MRARELANSDLLMEVIDGGNRLQFGRATGSLLALITTARGTGSNFHVPRLEGWTRTETDQFNWLKDFSFMVKIQYFLFLFLEF